MASAEKDEFVVTRSSDYDGDHEDQEERCHLQEPKVSGQVLVQQEASIIACKAAPVVQPREDNLLDLNVEPTGHETAAAAAAPAAMPVVQEDLLDLTEVGPATAVPASEMALSPGDLAGLDMGQARVASNPALDVQLLDLSLATETVTSNAVPSHNHDLLDLDQSWTQPTNIASASENLPRLDRPPVSSCSMGVPLPGNAGHQAEGLLG